MHMQSYSLIVIFYMSVQLGSASFHQSAVHYLCEDPEWAWQMLPHLSCGSAVTRLSLVKWVKEGRGWRGSRLQHELEKALQVNKSSVAVSKGGLCRSSVTCGKLYIIIFLSLVISIASTTSHNGITWIYLKYVLFRTCCSSKIIIFQGGENNSTLHWTTSHHLVVDYLPTTCPICHVFIPFISTGLWVRWRRSDWLWQRLNSFGIWCVASVYCLTCTMEGN